MKTLAFFILIFSLGCATSVPKDDLINQRLAMQKQELEKMGFDVSYKKKVDFKKKMN